jgi:hypothetical protein
MATILGAVLSKECVLLPAAKPKEKCAKAVPVSKRPASSSPDSAAKRHGIAGIGDGRVSLQEDGPSEDTAAPTSGNEAELPRGSAGSLQELPSNTLGPVRRATSTRKLSEVSAKAAKVSKRPASMSAEGIVEVEDGKANSQADEPLEETTETAHTNVDAAESVEESDGENLSATDHEGQLETPQKLKDNNKKETKIWRPMLAAASRPATGRPAKRPSRTSLESPAKRNRQARDEVGEGRASLQAGEHAESAGFLE